MGWAKRRRIAAGLFALAFATVACVSSNPVVGPGTPDSTVPGTGGPTETTVSPAPPRSQPSQGKTNPGGVPVATYDDDGSVGAMARTYLRRTPAASLTIEVDWVSGREPSQGALDHLASILERELDKPGGITIERGNRMTTSRSNWTISDLAALERANRDRHSAGSRATMWVGYVGGSFAPNGNALAVTYSASSAAIFRDRIDDATTAVVLAPEIEGSVLLHEVGHILALVNIGYRSRIAHEDAQHPHHSNNPGSVMYWAVEDISVRNLLTGGPPDDFDEADRADLAMLRGS